MTESDEAVRPLSETALCVRYKEFSNFRILSERDLSGNPEASEEATLSWAGHGAEVSWEDWETFCGGAERANEMLRNSAHEFELVGPGAEDFLGAEDGEEEFAIGGSAE